MVGGTGVSKTISAQEKKRKAMMFLKRLSEHGQEVLLDPRDEETLLSDDEKNDIERETRERLRAKKKPRPRDILASSAAFRSYCSVQEESASYDQTQETFMRMRESYGRPIRYDEEDEVFVR